MHKNLLKCQLIGAGKKITITRKILQISALTQTV